MLQWKNNTRLVVNDTSNTIWYKSFNDTITINTAGLIMFDLDSVHYGCAFGHIKFIGNIFSNKYRNLSVPMIYIDKKDYCTVYLSNCFRPQL